MAVREFIGELSGEGTGSVALCFLDGRFDDDGEAVEPCWLA